MGVSSERLWTQREIAERFNVQPYRVRYIVRSREIKPVRKAASVLLYSSAAALVIGNALKEDRRVKAK